MNHKCKEMRDTYEVRKPPKHKMWYVAHAQVRIWGMKFCPFCGKKLKNPKPKGSEE